MNNSDLILEELKSSVEDLKPLVVHLRDLVQTLDLKCEVLSSKITEMEKRNTIAKNNTTMDVNCIATQNLGKNDNRMQKELVLTSKRECKPVSINTVFGIVAQYLSLQDLKNCRLVEKMIWYPEATKRLERRGMVYFHIPFEEEKDELLMPCYKPVRKMANFFKEIPHLKIENICLCRGYFSEQKENFEFFFEQYGKVIKHLRIEYCISLKVLRRLLLAYLPNLVVLDLRVVPLMSSAKDSLFPKLFTPPDLFHLKRVEFWNCGFFPREVTKEFIHDIFSIGPNISAIKIVDRHETKLTETVLSVLNSNMKLKSNLKELEFDCRFNPTDEELSLLISMNLRLKALHLGVIHNLNSPKYFQALLESQCKTLESLQFGNVNADGVIQVTLPIFPNLRRLELTTDIPNGVPFGFLFGEISYHTTFPVLLHLAVCRSRIFYDNEDIMRSRIYSRMTHYVGKKFFTGMNNLWKELFPVSSSSFHPLTFLDIPFPKVKDGSIDNKFYLQLANMFPNVNSEFLKNLRIGEIKVVTPQKAVRKVRPPHSVYVLLNSVYEDLFPTNRSVIIDYGFVHCETEDSWINLFSVYVAMIKIFDCSLENLHQACIAGKLAEFIIAHYKAYGYKPKENVYFSWFLKNLHMVKNPYPLEEF